MEYYSALKKEGNSNPCYKPWGHHAKLNKTITVWFHLSKTPIVVKIIETGSRWWLLGAGGEGISVNGVWNFSFARWKGTEDGWWWWLHNKKNVLTALTVHLKIFKWFRKGIRNQGVWNNPPDSGRESGYRDSLSVLFLLASHFWASRSWENGSHQTYPLRKPKMMQVPRIRIEGCGPQSRLGDRV